MPSPLETDKAGVGETLADVLSGIVMMLFIIAVWFWCAGIIG